MKEAPEGSTRADERHQESSDSGKAADEPKANGNPAPAFGQSGEAIRELLAALRHDLQTLWRSGSLRMMNTASALREKYARPKEPGSNPALGTAAQRLSALPGKAMSSMATLRRWRLFSRRNPSSKRRSWLSVAAFASIACALVLGGVLIWALKDVPWREIAAGTLKPVIVLETADGAPLVRQGPYQGPHAAYGQFPQSLIDAVLSIEDRRFMNHYGIDPQGIGRALVRNFRAGSVVQGGSTITQQLIKLQYLESDRTLKRKIQEVVIAFWLEWKLGKQEILTRYLNAAYLGSGATGMPAAARIYFNKEIGDLNVSESALLAGLLKAPSQLNPIDNFEGARQRTATVLAAMVDNGKLTPDEAAAAKAEFGKLRPTTPTPRSGSWFADWISPQASEIAGASPGSTTVRTTLVPRLQRLAERVVTKALDEDGKALGASQAALVAMTPQGAVVAMVGGRDYKTSQFNRAVTAMRQPGSTFKLFVYYAALKKGLTLSDRVLDAPIEIDGWSPENSGGSYRGWVTLAEAFARSLNAATVALAQEVGLDNVVAAAKELGIDTAMAPTPSLALGTSEVNLLDLTSAYASVRLGKAPVEPWGILDFQAAGQSQAFRVGEKTSPSIDLSPYQSDLLGLLQLVVERGTGRDADPGTFAAGKTGTSQNNRDAWFVGFTEPLVVGVWVGNDDDTPMKGVTGGSLPARIWRDFIRAAMAEPAPGLDLDKGLATGGREPAPSCNITACSRSYRSFRASDCTYQPFRGERRLCER
ncbi:PBP1A family penicillin-binding protein [Rhizobium sp. CF080]|uniref:PBP1A family penicillin-binding protein n=1 Tax=Rhizobium sp. (strain CF080) TaxID=1144310 RepID=UPI001FD8C7C0|nr:PBP1A family penicillin-binding protein [Rhizobium sp. CF080]